MRRLQSRQVREPIVEGIFYPSDRQKLHKLISSLLESSAVITDGACGIISPHAGFRYSGAIAASAFKAARGRPIERVVLLAPIHRTEKDEVIFPESAMFKMPSGLIPVDRTVIEELISCSTQFLRDDIPHLEEHSVEVQLPFIPVLFPRAAIVPILIGKVKRATAVALARALSLAFEKKYATTLFVVSANLTSFMQGRDAKKEAERILDCVLRCDADGLLADFEAGKISSCGVPAMAVLMLLAGQACRVELLSSGSSAQTNRDFQELVHYAAVGFFKNKD